MTVALAAAVGVQQASAATVINACVRNSNGLTRIVASAHECHADEHFDSWSIQGPAGPIGSQGATGAQGTPGVAGQQGPAGPAGAKGATGATGAPGAQGVAGPQGPVGATGATGAAGPAGAPGQNGAVGTAGPAGPTGAQGPEGPAGAPGTIPANLQALSDQLSPSGYNNGNFHNASSCYVGDIVLSVNGYGTTGGGTDSGAWTPADGSLLPINTDTALFSLIGTTFGGDGTTNFALPDLRPFAPKGLQYSICMFGIFPSKN
jgi:hypothetical protein